tara:strand:- start:1485 stop:2282 length:798 start_codon:yes stop_codon:yes gene_type:complete
MEEDCRIVCPLCNGSITYPSEWEGEEVNCPHCKEPIYLLGKELPPPPPKPDKPIPRKKVTSVRKGVIKKNVANPSATPPNRKKIIPPKTGVIAIPHLFTASELEKEGTRMSHEIIYREPADFNWYSRSRLGRASDDWKVRWIGVHVQDKKTPPWVSLLLEAEQAEPFSHSFIEIRGGDKTFKLPGDSNIDKAGAEQEPVNKLTEKYGFEHDDFRYLCAMMAEHEDIEISVDGLESDLADGLCQEFREYTLCFFEAMRRELPIFFR